MSIRVLIVDDHAVVRSGLRLLLEAEKGIEPVGEAQQRRPFALAAEAEKTGSALSMPLMRVAGDNSGAICPSCKRLSLNLPSSRSPLFQLIVVLPTAVPP